MLLPLLVLAAAVPAPSAAAAPADTGATPRVTASLDTTATTVGGRITLHLDVDTPEGWFVEPPAPPASLGSFRVRGVQPAERTDAHRRFDVLLVPVEPGEQEVPAITLVARRGAGEPLELASPSLKVAVASNLEAPAAAPDSAAATGGPKPAALKPALEPPRDWRPVWIAALAAAVAGVAAFLLARRLRRRGKPEVVAPPAPRKPARPAWEIAFAELDRIASERRVERGELRRQYEAVTEALRRYLENRWGVPALESTTDDVRALLHDSAVPAEIAGRVLSLLSEADLVKFAKARPEEAAARALEGRARAIVQDSIPREPERQGAAA